VTRGLLDTSVFIADEAGRAIALTDLPDEVAVSVITVGELHAGVLAAADVVTRARRLRMLASVLALDPVPIDADVAQIWGQLRVELRDLGRRMPLNDSWIAATALHLGVPVVTQDADFDDVPALSVLRV
jgi:predicted nucleic acid-binding protein